MEALIFDTLSDFKSMEGKALPTGNWYRVTQEMIDHFAEATHDKQWIHVDVARAAKASPTGTTIAHGFMSVAMLSKLLEEVFTIRSLTMGLNYGLNKVRFPNPVPVNSELQLHSSVQQIEDMGTNGIKVTFSCVVAIKGEEKPACVAEFIAALFE